MTRFQTSILILNGIFACWVIIRAETVLHRVDQVTATANRALDAMPVMQAMLDRSDRLLDKSRAVGASAADRLERAIGATRGGQP